MTAVNTSSKKASVYKQWTVGFIATTSMLTYGLQSGWVSPAIPTLQSENSPAGYPLSNYEISLIASGISVLATFTAVIYGYISDAIGRRWTLVAIVVPQILCFALKLISAHPICLMVSQACAGVAGGGIFTVSPIYIKEIAQDSLRGVMGSSGMFLGILGQLTMYAMGGYMSYYTVLWIVVWLPILNLIALFKIPESPAFLIKKGKVEEATKVMAWLRGVEETDKEVERDISIAKNEIATYENLPAVSWKTILSNKVSRRALFFSFLALTLLDLGGNYAILVYASVILQDSGVTISPELQALSFPALFALGCLLSIFTVEKFGRKPLMITSAILIGVPLAVLGTLLLIQEKGGSFPSWLTAVCICACLYASGLLYPLPYVVMSEIFSIELRTKVLGVIVTSGWLFCALQALLFTPISEYFGRYTLFFGFACFNFIGAVLCYITMPETKGKTVEQIEKEFGGGK
ncbi:solute carrier family 2, facilitated glucose transporter member 6-like [Leguminivora glycinivorella]|uniref:solute carrier family 2, facilitated glucose transporter member 6-like n=1 Tax=Leguminivora glycinivorella TaxID=1035111 RepID=UPI00200F4910|nr:solute carrier family 2, facilitated glucose transporter member 6-like [Leguminivora glycinivorella]